MQSNREVSLRMSEEHFLELNEREKGSLHQFRTDEEKSDWSENMNDVYYAMTYKKIKVLKKELSEREFQLRENRRKIIK